MKGLSVKGSPVAPNAGANTALAADIARRGQVGNRRVSTLDSVSLGPIREHLGNTTAATPSSARTVRPVPDDPTRVPISWFTERLPATELGGLADEMRGAVNFAREIDHDMLRASALLEKSESKPLNEKEQREVNTLLRAGKYNLAQVQRWAMIAVSEFEGYPTGLDFVTRLHARLADRHMDLADLMCRYDIDQAPPEQAVSRADRIDYDLIAADAALKVVGGLAAIGLSEAEQQELVGVLEDHRAALGTAKDVAIGGDTDGSLFSKRSNTLSKAMWDTPFNLTKGKQRGAHNFVSALHKHWDAKVAGASGTWLPLSRFKLTQEKMLQEFVGYRLKQIGVAKENMPDLKFQFKEATIRTLNERPWEPIEKEMHYAVAGASRAVHSKITPAKAMAAGRFAEDFTANGINCSDRMQYTHVPNLARTELTDESGKTLFSALRHGVLDAYDISASSLRKLPDQALRTTVKDLLVPYVAKEAASEEPDAYSRIASESPYADMDFDGGGSKADSTGKAAVGGTNADPTVALTYGDDDYATVRRMQGLYTSVQRELPEAELPPEVPAPYSEEAWESTFVHPGNNDKIAYLGKLQDTCPEQSAVFVANYFNLDCKFETYKNTGQIDIFLPISINAPPPGVDRPMLFTDGKSEASCFNYLQSLDKSAVYVMRTGQNELAGHNQILYSKDNEWHVYDSEENQSQLTSRGSLTEAGSDRMVKKYATWGTKGGEASIATAQVTKEGARALIGYVKDCRNKTEGTAMLNLYASGSNDSATPGEDPGGLQAAGSARIASESPYADIDPDGAVSKADSAGKTTDVSDADREQRVDQIVNAIRMNKTEATKYAFEMRTAASVNMAKELAVAALVGDPAKLQDALDGKVVDLNLSSISLLTPDRLRSNPTSKSNEREMLRRQTDALQSLVSGSGTPTSLQVRDAEGELRIVKVNCKVRTFNFGVNAGAVGRAKHIPSHLRGWDKLMGWGYAMERNNPELRTLLGDPGSVTLGGEVSDKINALIRKTKELRIDLSLVRRTQQDGTNPQSTATISKLEGEYAATVQDMNTLQDAGLATKKIWREGSYIKGGQDPYKMVSRLGIVINAMGETLTFNCKSGKDRTGQLDAELKYLTALNTAGRLPEPGAPVTPQLRQMRSDFTLTSGNLEMQRMNTGLPGFKLNIKEVPGLANFIAGPEMESTYRGGSNYIKS